MKIPKRSEMQKSKIRRLCGQLYKNYKDFIWILDDESILVYTIVTSTPMTFSTPEMLV